MEGTRLINLVMRASEFLWILLVLALVGNMLSIQSGPSVINYDMFTAVFAMLSLLYLVPATVTDRIAFHWAVPFTLDLLNVLFIFCAAVATPGYLGVPNCSDYNSIVFNVVSLGSTQRCREAQATTAFLWFAWASFVVSLVLTALQGRGGSAKVTGPRRGPVMSQV